MAASLPESSTGMNERVVSFLPSQQKKDQNSRRAFDVGAAYLNATLDEPVFVHGPPFVSIPEGCVWRLNTALYGKENPIQPCGCARSRAPQRVCCFRGRTSRAPKKTSWRPRVSQEHCKRASVTPRCRVAEDHWSVHHALKEILLALKEGREKKL